MNIPGASAFTSLSRRLRTLIVAGLAFVVLVVLGFTLPVPYSILTPGPTCNTIGSSAEAFCPKDIIQVSGRATNKVSGHLNLVTVNVTYPNQRETIFNVLQAWLSHDRVAVPKTSVYPPGESTKQVNNQNAQDFTESQDDAVAAASCELGYPKQSGVVEVLGPSGSYGKLQPADIIKTVDGAAASNETELEAALATHKAGDTVSVVILRAGVSKTVQITLGKPNKTGGNPTLGIEYGPVCQLPFTVSICEGCNIGGPSAGMMFALGIMDEVGKVDLTNGQFIAGTGEIDAEGNVSAIGGIALKMIAARQAGATVFLAPTGNCGDVKGAIPKGLDVISVSTLHGAVTALEDLHAGKAVPHCPA